MKRLIPALVLCVTVLFVFAGSSLAETSMPDLTGKWTSKNYAHHHEKTGFFSNKEADGKWTIKEQQGRFFSGERSYTKKATKPAKSVTEGFSGVISRDGTRLYLVDHDEDILLGEILPDGSIELIMINDGDKNQHSKIGLLELERAK
ncbi:hypothetical protein [Thiovibrio frasassiensis]|uniref:Lipocalin-like domain-containing protein n=1 Tax=Thiovibrio frasassiensis TaxID=2984131 RepID=A0A9X4MEM3_9BACT|nr:hypothetical protein [Thiovibrio frasassiensis]MDG4474735.1 hypothetical protein [Thiovibrio frasassiensis]